MKSEAERIADALDGRPIGPGRWLCRCPLREHGRGRGDRNPSLSVGEGDRTVLVFCHAGCIVGEVLDELRHRGLIEDDRAPVQRANRPCSPRSPELEHRPDPAALAIWKAALPAEGTIVADYLGYRNVTLPIPPSLRFGRTSRGGPAMIAAVQAPDRRIIAVQALALTPEGRKATVTPVRVTTGGMGHGAVRLAAATDVLGIAEGVETALSAMQLTGVPTWATLGGQRLAKIDVPSSVRELTIFADNDQAGLDAAKAAAARFAETMVVHVRLPPARCGDWNDLLLRGRYCK